MTQSDHTNQNGVFPSQWIEEAIRGGIIKTDVDVEPKQIQPNSLDLRMGTVAYRVTCSFLPGAEGMEHKLQRFTWYEVSIRESGTILERNQVYLIPLRESLALPDHISGSANPKSSTGRLDVFTRIVTENGSAFDEVPAGYHGKLYMEVVPRSFAITVRPDDCLAQIRFQTGSTRLTDTETREMLDTGDVVVSPSLRVMRSSELRIQSGVFLSVYLGLKRDELIGYRARKNQPPIDLRGIGKASSARYWDPIHYRPGQPVILEPDEFYIFASKEQVRLPPSICAEMVPFDAGSGELRTHYAGFFDSGFGYTPGEQGFTRAAAVVLEIRNRDVPFMIDADQPLFRLVLLRNTEQPDRLYGAGSNYQFQRLKLGKQFADIDENLEDQNLSLEFDGGRRG
jgi:dCTP deaminase